MDDAEMDVLAYLGHSAKLRARLHSTNSLERLNDDTKRPGEVVGVFLDEAAVIGSTGALLLKQNDKRVVQACSLHDPGNQPTAER